jgi:thioredoxin 1
MTSFYKRNREVWLKFAAIRKTKNNFLKNHIMAVEITDANFDELVMKTDKPVLLDFWAEWCGPCRLIGPIVEEIAKEQGDNALVGKVNVDENPQAAMKFGIRNIPTVLYIKNGEIADKQVGATSKDVLEGKLTALM